jgi:predicted secreted protein
MTVTAALVLFAITWFMVFFIVLPLRLTTQGDAGHVAPGTHASSPAGHVVARKARLATFIAVPLTAGMAFVILSGWIGISDLARLSDWLGRP